MRVDVIRLQCDEIFYLTRDEVDSDTPALDPVKLRKGIYQGCSKIEPDVSRLSGQRASLTAAALFDSSTTAQRVHTELPEAPKALPESL